MISMSQNSRDNLPCVWAPDLEIFSNAGTEQELNNPKVIVYHNGTVHMFRLGLIRIIASYTMGNYPFDVQTVQLVISPMSYFKELVDVRLLGEGIEIEDKFF